MGSKLPAWEIDCGLLSSGAGEKRKQHLIGPLKLVWKKCVSCFVAD